MLSRPIRHLLLIISGSVAAYKSLELIRLLRARGVTVQAILTAGGAQFITPLSVSSLTGTKTYTALFDLTDELEMGHIALARAPDAVLVAPASADMLARMAAGRADDLAATALLATDKPIFVAPAMNHRMWHHKATQRNLAQLRADGVQLLMPGEGEMACGEYGLGRMMEPAEICESLLAAAAAHAPLAGRHAIVTAGGTREAIDPVRYLGNHSSGKQGIAVARALHAAGARVTLIHGAIEAALPAGVTSVEATNADAMLQAVRGALPADILVAAAAVADWRPVRRASEKLKKSGGNGRLSLEFMPTVDVLQAVASGENRPRLIIGFAAETQALLPHARAKRQAKGADWMVANSVANASVFGQDTNEVTLITPRGEQRWPRQSKDAIAQKLVAEIARTLAPKSNKALKRAN